MSTPRHIRAARRQRHDPWGPTAPAALDPLAPIDYEVEAIPGLEVRELPEAEGMAQFELAKALINAKECDE